MSSSLGVFHAPSSGWAGVAVSGLCGIWWWICGLPVRNRGEAKSSFFTVAMLALLSKPDPENIDPKSPPMSITLVSRGAGLRGMIGACVYVVVPLDPVRPGSAMMGMGGGKSGIGGSSSGGGMLYFFCPPNEKVRPARSKNLDPMDLFPRPCISDDELLGGPFRLSSWNRLPPLKSAEEGAVEALLWREEVSVDVVCVVLDKPLPLCNRVSIEAKHQ
jgi:hypothetical protein